ncbi:amidohydrolase family protein [Algoriphagus sp. D3-2-R+10]|uniref:amidohydrolase family protein n=1 Tax=Algoriphagus aurantiacus TaxID=3103948 RepID=UPI002B384D62|nr:amidohydrolase family protein [Algoriphagus sp. D3-2-R+10]MEB2777417.1 amidohydrolase family protein [Algoriphagus sp. D3-2-R+10]
MKCYYKILMVLFLVSTGISAVRAQTTFARNGVADERGQTYALVNATVITGSKKIENAIILVKGKLIEQVGSVINIPKGYRQIGLKGKYVYPAFIDPYSQYGLPPVKFPPRSNPVIKREQIDPARSGAYNANDAIRADYQAVRDFRIDSKIAEDLRRQGFASVSAFLPDGVVRGTSVVVNLGESSENEVVVKSEGAVYFSMDKGSSLQDYPNTPMGALSLVRQTMYDAEWYGQFDQKPFTDLGLEAINSQKSLPKIFESSDWMMAQTVDRVGTELGLDFIIKGSGDEYQRVGEIAGMKRKMVIPLNFPKPFDVSDTLFNAAISLQDLKHWEMAPMNAAFLAKAGVKFAFTSDGLENRGEFLDNVKKAVAAGLSKETALAALTSIPAEFFGLEDVLGGVDAGKFANLIVASGDIFEQSGSIEEVWVQGESYRVTSKPDRGTVRYTVDKIDDSPKMIYPFTAYGTSEQVKPEDLLIKGATVWTSEQEGILSETDVLIQSGKIVRIGKGLSVKGVKIIDGTGKHLTAGIIDEHSHIALKSINEMAINTSMVRMEDVINSEDVQIYRALAGGVVVAQLLHGSANAIGGQSALVKLKWGQTAADLIIPSAPRFIKFALGENPKRSKSDPSIRFPKTMMGMEQVYTDAFTQAREYEKEWTRYQSNAKNGSGIKPRIDLVNQAMLDVLKGDMFITCHAYVQSEMLMLMDVADRFGFTVNTFTHALEGYKIADELKVHGAGGATFSDRWNFKWEARTAIPYNTVLMHGQGVVTAVNSDSGELMRHLNQEAAKSVRYGGMDEQEALKLVTLNPAKLLHLDDSMGSIKVGKSADLVLWSGHPLSVYSKAEKTLIEGGIYFDLERDQVLREEIRLERNRLITKMGNLKNQGVATVQYSSNLPFEAECDFTGMEEYFEENH